MKDKSKANTKALYYTNKLIALGMEARRLQDELEAETGIQICGLGAMQSFKDKSLYLLTCDSIEKLGLPIKVDDEGEEKIVEVNGYRVIEVID